MAMTDPIADMLTRIRNAIVARHESVDIPYSNMKFSIAKLMKDEGFIRNYKVFVNDTRKKFLKVYISYDENDNSVITGLRRISKPGRRVYMNVEDTKKKRNRMSTVILTTSRGILTDAGARKNNVGGEPLLMVW